MSGFDRSRWHTAQCIFASVVKYYPRWIYPSMKEFMFFFPFYSTISFAAAIPIFPKSWYLNKIGASHIMVMSKGVKCFAHVGARKANCCLFSLFSVIKDWLRMMRSKVYFRNVTFCCPWAIRQLLMFPIYLCCPLMSNCSSLTEVIGKLFDDSSTVNHQLHHDMMSICLDDDTMFADNTKPVTIRFWFDSIHKPVIDMMRCHMPISHNHLHLYQLSKKKPEIIWFDHFISKVQVSGIKKCKQYSSLSKNKNKNRPLIHYNLTFLWLSAFFFIS